MRKELVFYSIQIQEAVRKRLDEIYTADSYDPYNPTEEQNCLQQIDELIYRIYLYTNIAYPSEFPKIEERS